MNALSTPGLHRLPALPARAAGPLARGDVALFLGYARRGPVGAPVRVEGLAMFEGVFGERPRHGHLWGAVKGFFETGGAACYILRVTGPDAAAATAAVGAWTAQASFAWPMIDPRRLGAATAAAAAAWVQLVEARLREDGARSPDPGAWGDALELEIAADARARTLSAPDASVAANEARLESTAGIETASVARLSQPGAAPVHARIEAVDAARSLVRLSRAPSALGLDPTRPIRVETVEFSVLVRRAGRLEQRFDGLAPDPAHPRALAAVLQRDCRALHLSPPEAADWTDPASWPPVGRFALRGGRDGLTTVGPSDWTAALEPVRRVTEAALLAAPDLTLDATEPALAAPAPGATGPDCGDLSAPQTGVLAGVAFTAGGGPLAGVRVEATGTGVATTTDLQGRFEARGAPPGLITLRLSKAGHEPLEALAVATTRPSGELARFDLAPIDAPAALDEQAVASLSQALANPAVVGPWKVAIVDPPSSANRVDLLRAWRARLGDSDRMGLFGPWLLTPDAGGGLTPTPPSGHVCGAFAAAEREAGPHLGGANRALRFADAVAFPIDDAEHGLLNGAGVNAIRALPGRGVRAMGLRTLSSDPSWRFLTVRRLIDAVARTLERGLAWAVFEPNGVTTRQAVLAQASALLADVWRRGMLAGPAPEAAFTLKCDAENNPEDGGALVLDVGLAPAEPYEFIVFRLGLTQDAAKVTE